jgi:hypothetical protein
MFCNNKWAEGLSMNSNIEIALYTIGVAILVWLSFKLKSYFKKLMLKRNKEPEIRTNSSLEYHYDQLQKAQARSKK